MSKTTAAAILAGGGGRRLGGFDKALVTVGGQRLVELVHATIKPQTGLCALCLRAPKDWTEEFGLPVLVDRPSPERGPLGGVAAALAWSQALSPPVDWVITVPVDLPFLPTDLVVRLTTEDTSADVAVAKSRDQIHYSVAAWKPELCDTLSDAIDEKPMAVHQFQSTVKTVQVEWPVKDGDPFFNINTPEDLAFAEAEKVKG